MDVYKRNVRQHKRRQRALILSRILIVVGVLVLCSGGVLAWRQHLQNKTAQHHVEQAARASGNPVPSTVKPAPNEFDNYHVAPNQPRYIFIPSLSVKAMVKPEGVNKNNQIIAPNNIHDAGWFTGSTKPGEPGAILVDGHVSSWTARGVFYDIKKLKPGDVITIERSDGQEFSYEVVKSRVYDADKVDMQAALSAVNPNKPGLNLITCDGNVVKGTNEFDKRVVVFAEQQ